MRHFKLLHLKTKVPTPDWVNEGTPPFTIVDGVGGVSALCYSVCEDDLATPHKVLLVSPETISSAPTTPEEPYDFICSAESETTQVSPYPDEDFHTKATAQISSVSEDVGPALAALGFFLYRFGWSERNTLMHGKNVSLTLVSRPGNECSVSAV